MKVGFYILKFVAGIGTILLMAIGNSFMYNNRESDGDISLTNDLNEKTRDVSGLDD